MALDPGSPILAALYQRKRDEAERLADGAALSIWEAAALGRDHRLAELLRETPALVNAWAADGFTPLQLASFFSTVRTVQLLLDAGAAVAATARNDMGIQALHAAIAARNRDAARLLLERGADPNARQQLGYTPLMGAASAGFDDTVSLLLARGADPLSVSDDGKTAAAIALEHGHGALAEQLSRASAAGG